MIFDSFDSPVKESIPSFEDEKFNFARFIGSSSAEEFCSVSKSAQVIDIYLSVKVSLSKLSVSSTIVGLLRVSTIAETPLLSPDGVKIEESKCTFKPRPVNLV